MTADELFGWLRAHSVEMVDAVRAGKCNPQPVRRVTIPKEEKGRHAALRNLGWTCLGDVCKQSLSDGY